jgi:hypothetical protein
VRKAKEREEEMMSRMRLTKLRPDEVSKLTEREIKTMPEFRYSITKRRPTPEEIVKGETDGEWKVRIVSKDLKCKKKKPAKFTHSKVPPTSDFRLLGKVSCKMYEPGARVG